MRTTMRLVRMLGVAAVVAGMAASVRAEEGKPLPLPTEFDTVYLVHLEPGRTPVAGKADGEAIAAHIQFYLRLQEEGRAVAAGPVQDGERKLAGAAILRADSAQAARELAESDPGAKAGLFRVRVLPWSVPKGRLLKE